MPRPDVDTLPVLPTLNVAETMDFYQNRLGLDELVHKADDYLILRRPGIEIHFWLTDRREFCENSSVYIRGGGIDDLHAEFTGNDVPKLTPLMDRPWGMREFYVHDSHGNLLRFGRNAPAEHGPAAGSEK
ncbi:MAG: VOC family protein [Phyllobacteriaceae bacterium]|nr:VOC family protein [Phyllobacteriaceae bacterium]